MSGKEDFKPGHRNRVIDDRGRKVAMLEVADLPPKASPELRKAVRNANRHRFVAIARVLVIVFIAMVLLQLALSAGNSQSFWKGMGEFFRKPGMIYFFIFIGGGWFGAEQVKAFAKEAVRVCFAARICPSCGYSLANLAAAEDGCTVCPECGAAWRLPEAAA